MTDNPTKPENSKIALIQSLNPDDAFRVLMVLLTENPDLEEKVHQISMRVLCSVDFDDITLDVYGTLNVLDPEDLFAICNSSRSYVEPSEMAWSMFEDALEPFVDEMRKYQKRSMPVEAKKYCIGIIKGIQKFEYESGSDFLDWVDDAPYHNIENVIDEWKKGEVSEEDIAEILEIVNAEDV